MAVPNVKEFAADHEGLPRGILGGRKHWVCFGRLGYCFDIAASP